MWIAKNVNEGSGVSSWRTCVLLSSACSFHWLQPVNLLHLSLLRNKTYPSLASSFSFSYYLIFTLCHLEILNKECASIDSTAWDHRTFFFPLLQTSSPWLMRNHTLYNHSFLLSCVGNSLSSCPLNISFPHCQLSKYFFQDLIHS